MAANLPIIRIACCFLNIPTKGIGIKYTDVPRKNARKKKILLAMLPVSMAPVIARRKGGHMFIPERNPPVTGTMILLILPDPGFARLFAAVPRQISRKR